MDWSTIENAWNEYKNNVKLRWSRIPDAQIDEMQGRHENLSRTVQEVYSLSREDAERQIAAWVAKQPVKTPQA